MKMKQTLAPAAEETKTLPAEITVVFVDAETQPAGDKTTCDVPGLGQFERNAGRTFTDTDQVAIAVNLVETNTLFKKEA